MIEISKALKIIERETPELGAERVPLGESVGRVLREKILADTDLPPFDRSQMDGYAVVAADTQSCPVTLKIVGESAAGRCWHKRMDRGEAVRIMTGAPVPAGANAVQRVEDTSGWEGDAVTILKSVAKGMSVVKRGAEVKQGTIVFHAGEIVTENKIPALASFGYARLSVSKVPTISIMATGSEIVPLARKPGRDQIRNSNSIMLDVSCRRLRCSTSVLETPRDDLFELKAKIHGIKSDILIITGGVSAGKYDLTTRALEELGCEIFFEKVRLKPGKPAVFARRGKTLIFGLPGNPVSAAVTFQLFVRKAILLMQGIRDSDLSPGFAVLENGVRAPRDRDAYIPAALGTDVEGRLIAIPLKSQGSSDFVGFSRAEALIKARRGTDLDEGSVAEVLFL